MFNTVNSVAVMALLLTSIYIADNKEYLTKKTNYFRCVRVYSAFSQLYCMKFSFKLANMTEAMKDGLGVHFLSSHSAVLIFFARNIMKIMRNYLHNKSPPHLISVATLR